MSDLGHSRNRTRRSRGTDRSPIGKRPPCPRCGATMLPALEFDDPYCLRCLDSRGFGAGPVEGPAPTIGLHAPDSLQQAP